MQLTFKMKRKQVLYKFKTHTRGPQQQIAGNPT